MQISEWLVHRRALIAVVAVLAMGAALSAGDYKPPDLPQVFHAKTYPLHETHDDERVAIAIDPYFEPEKADLLRVPYRKHNLLPVRFIITNDGNGPISLRGLKIQFITSHNEKQEPATPDAIGRRLANQPKPQSGTQVPIPIPLPRKSPKRVSGGAIDEIEYLQFKAKAVEPHTTQAGFLFFDTSGMADPLEGSHLYLSGIRNDDGQELFYFDLPMKKSSASGENPSK